MEPDDNSIIDESENWNSGQKSFGFKDIVMRQLQKVVSNMSQEMREGFNIYSQSSPSGTPQKLRYVGDSRKELRNSIDVLHDLLLAKFDDEMKKQSELLYDEYEKYFNKYNHISNIKDDDRAEFWRIVLKIYRKLFQHLCLFLERLGWLEAGALED